MLGIYSMNDLTDEKLKTFFDGLGDGSYAKKYKNDLLLWENINFFFDKTTTLEERKSKHYRAIYFSGSPIEVPETVYSGGQDRKQDQ